MSQSEHTEGLAFLMEWLSANKWKAVVVGLLLIGVISWAVSGSESETSVSMSDARTAARQTAAVQVNGWDVDNLARMIMRACNSGDVNVWLRDNELGTAVVDAVTDGTREACP